VKRFLAASLIAATPFLSGCVSTGMNHASSYSPSSIMGHAPSIPVDPSNNLSILSWIGGLSILVGLIALMLTRGSMGMRPIIGGVLLVTLNFAIMRYAHFIFIPAIVCTGIISIAWSYVQVRKIIEVKKEQRSAAPTPETAKKRKKK